MASIRTALDTTEDHLREIATRNAETRAVREPVDHILRPRLPWRRSDEAAITECGYNAASVKTISREQYFARLQELGQQRSAMFTCMTCSDTAKRWTDWAGDPRKAVEREIDWECGYGRHRANRRTLLKHELLAIADLIEAHSDEFEQAVLASQQREDWIEQKALRTQKISRRPKHPSGIL
jgi:hypothetical protein